VLAWASMPNSEHASVGFDNRAAMRLLADKVIEMGHRRIAVISGIVDGNDRAAERLAGIQDSWQAHGFHLNDLPNWFRLTLNRQSLCAETMFLLLG